MLFKELNREQKKFWWRKYSKANKDAKPKRLEFCSKKLGFPRTLTEDEYKSLLRDGADLSILSWMSSDESTAVKKSKISDIQSEGRVTKKKKNIVTKVIDKISGKKKEEPQERRITQADKDQAMEELKDFWVEQKVAVPMYDLSGTLTKFAQDKLDYFINKNIWGGEPVDILIAFDITSSMNAYHSDVKKQVKELIPKFFQENPNLRISIIAFGDYVDVKKENPFNIGKRTDLSIEEIMGSVAFQYINFTDNVDSLISFMNGVQYDCSGGDWQEFYGLVLNSARKNFQWRKGSQRSILLIADAEDHLIGKTYDGFTNIYNWEHEIPYLRAENIKVDTLTIREDTVDWYRKLSEMTQGKCLPFKSSTKTGQMLELYTYARSGSTISFADASSSVMHSGDAELIGFVEELGTL